MSFLQHVTEKAKTALGDTEDHFHAAAHSHIHLGTQCHHLHRHEQDNRFLSFAPPRTGNNVKWFVDGCGYMWAVSVAIEEAKESIWILDWWLSPELYLRRPPSKNQKYRLDRMLLAAAERGVKVNIIIYKEVSNVLTLCSKHTKAALEKHPNIAVLRHPDHLLTGQVLESEILSTIKNLSLKSHHLTKLPEDALKALYGLNDDVVLYWAHHEKLCLIDGKTAFMGGLDLCFGRWDTYSHHIADAHPTDLDQVLFPGQDYNNARIYDFEDVSDYDRNKLKRTQSSRMGWSDLSICIDGPMIEDLRAHFVQRWNFIYWEKYEIRKDKRYQALSLNPDDVPDHYYKPDGSVVKRVRETNLEDNDPTAGIGTRLHLPGGVGSIFDTMRESLPASLHGTKPVNEEAVVQTPGGMSVQLVRSCTGWSNGCHTEHSIANAYIKAIHDSQHFVYIENQFFITATSNSQHPVRNKLGAALVERIVRAWKNGETYRVTVCMPSVPAFAGDLHSDAALGTRAIMNYQYHSICRGGYSIMEAVEKAGVPDAKKYIRFYNLRNYDRIHANDTMASVEKDSGVAYEDARREHDDLVGAGYDGRGEGTGATSASNNDAYSRYQQSAGKENQSQYDTVSGCYMDKGVSIKDIPWFGNEESEMDAFVSEELYIHSKVLIADDRVVICGSANLNDRSQLGYHDSEIAVVIEDPTPVTSVMNGQPFQASRFATSLRRQLFRKHLGLLPFQDWTKPDDNFLPLYMGTNTYDWNSPSDLLVRDVLSRTFSNLWDGIAKANTEIYAKAFHCVPADNVLNWKEYEHFYSKWFINPGSSGNFKTDDNAKAPKYKYGHVVKEEFPGGVNELKDWLDQVRGTLVDMPLHFMEQVDFAKEGLTLNIATEEIYT